VTTQLAPQNLDAETYLLGALLMEGARGAEATLRKVEELQDVGLTPGAFYFKKSHGEIFAAICAVAARGNAADFLVVEDELRRRGTLETVGGETKIRELANLAPATANATHHAQLILDEALRREVGRKLDAARDANLNGGLDAHPEIIEQLADLAARPTSTPTLEPLWLRDALGRDLPPVREYVEGLLEAGVVAEIAGLPYTHKSGLALELACKVAAGRGELLGRFPILASVPVAYFWGDDSEANELGRLQAYARHHGFEREPIAFCLNPLLDLTQGVTLLAHAIAEHGFRLVVLDSIYNFAPGLNWNAGDEVTRLYGAFKRMCDEHAGLTIVLVDHAPKPSESTKGRSASISSFGSVFKAAQVRCSIALERDGERLFVSARANNVRGIPRTLAAFDEDSLELRLVDSADRDYRSEAVSYVDNNPGATATDVAKGISCRPDNAKSALEAAAADGEAHMRSDVFKDAAGRRQKRQGWYPGPEEGRIFPDPGTTRDDASLAAGHGDGSSEAPSSPVGAGARDGASGQGGAGGGSTR
jgi:hypothetical protein